ncbi:glucose-1-phosphate thymidylyltransferase [Thermoplasmatales archaeon ex4484_6]|nr:MAG: glucose-1-phosphate thymidylyltransferase [Thermoplasmatales archaeon ex4484_6]
MGSMDAVLLAGGFARRMWPLTRDRPKHLLPVAGREMLSFTLDPLLEMDQVRRIYISTNEAFGERFAGFLNGYDDERIELVIEPSPSEERKLGSIGGLGYLIESRGLSRDTILIGADNMFEFHPGEAVKVFDLEGKDLVAVYDVGEEERARLYGIVDVNENGVIERFLEKPDDPPSTLAATAFYIFKADTVKLVPEYLNEGRPGDALGHFITYLVERRPVIAWRFPGRWFDIGSLEIYHEADEYFKSLRKI